MLKFKRPEKPPDFDSRSTPYKTAVKKAIDDKKKPEFDDDFWKSYKSILAKSQNGKCGYCEMQVIGSGYGDVEHYAPKSEVSELNDDPKTWGRELDDLSNVHGRKPEKKCERGYWWLAYEWENYLFACKICNQAWKKTIFPVQENPRCNPPEEAADETPLLLNPFGLKDPIKHLIFNDLGMIESRDNSPFGRETIKTCGLDRPSLMCARKDKAQWAFSLVREFKKAKDNEDTLRVLEDFHRLGKSTTPHAGMVRSIFEEEIGLDWEVVEELFPED